MVLSQLNVQAVSQRFQVVGNDAFSSFCWLDVILFERMMLPESANADRKN